LLLVGIIVGDVSCDCVALREVDCVLVIMAVSVPDGDRVDVRVKDCNSEGLGVKILGKVSVRVSLLERLSVAVRGPEETDREDVIDLDQE